MKQIGKRFTLLAIVISSLTLLTLAARAEEIFHSPFLAGNIIAAATVSANSPDTVALRNIASSRRNAIEAVMADPQRDKKIAQIKIAEIDELEKFLDAHPDSPWAPSLLAAMGKYYRDLGRYSEALDYWQTAWQQTGSAQTGPAKQIADYTLVQWTRLLASLGRVELLKDLFNANRDRVFTNGGEAQMWARTREGFEHMVREPSIAYKCGVFALHNAARAFYGKLFYGLFVTPSPETGFSLSELESLSDRYNLDFIPVYRDTGAELIVPSVVHWKENHYAAVVAEKDGRYEVIDPTFGGKTFMDAATLNAETSGYFMVPATTALPSGWRRVATPEASQVFGRGYPYRLNDPDDQGTSCPMAPGSNGSSSGNNSGPGPNGPGSSGANGGPPHTGGFRRGGGVAAGAAPCCGGMPAWKVTEPYINLWLNDTPFAYQPSSGPSVSFDLSYKQRDENASETPGFSSVGSGWNCNWFSFVSTHLVVPQTDNTIPVALPGGGTAFYFIGASDTTAPPDYFNHYGLKMVTDVNHNITSFERTAPDGSKFVYGYSVPNFTEAFFLTAVVDGQGRQLTFSYLSDNASYAHLSTVTDSDGNVVHLYYENASFPDLVTRVADSTRTAYLSSSDNVNLTSIQDVAGITSTIAYDTSYVPQFLTTPYGTTGFHYDTGPFDPENIDRYITIVDPEGGKQTYAFASTATEVPQAFDSNTIPQGTPLGTLDYQQPDAEFTTRYALSSFYWNREQSSHLSTTNIPALNSNDFKRPRWRRWLGHNNILDTPFDVNTLSTEQAASSDGVTDGQITWYDYEGKTYSDGQGTQILPGVIARVQPDGTTWYKYFQRNLWGNVTNEIERWTNNSVGFSRTNQYVYSADGTDLLYHRGPSDDANHARVGYAYDSVNHPHLPIRMTNAVNEVATYTYDSSHRLATELTPTGVLSTYTYDGTSHYLTKVVDSVSGTPTRTNSFTWQNGLVHTKADERGLTTTFNYDLLNRPTTTIYPDGTGETNLYVRADGSKIIDRAFFYDRLGHKTSFVWDGLQRLVYQTNALGAVTHYDYCDCGGLAAAVQGLGTAVQSTTSFYYDEAGHRTNVVLGDGTSITNAFDSLGQIIITRNALGSTTNYFDNVERLVAVWNAAGQVLARDYDQDDRVIYTINANGVELVDTFDAAGRLLTHRTPNTGVEKFGYTANIAGPSSYTNQLSKVWQYVYDPYGRKTNEVAVGVYTNSFAYSPAGDLLTLRDGKSQVTSWKYDLYGRVTNKTDAVSSEILRYQYDAASRLTNRWSAGKGSTVYRYDANNSLTNVDYPASTDLTYNYDAIGRLSSMVDAAGTTSFTRNGAGKLLTEDGPWATDVVTYTYNTAGLRASMSIQQPTGSFTNGYRYDASSRLTNVTSTAGSFSYYYHPGADGGPDAARLVQRISLPNSSYITNFYNSSGQLTQTDLKNGTTGSILDHQAYVYNIGNQRTKETRTDSGYVDYLYDNVGEVYSAKTYTSGGSPVAAENFGYLYDPAFNLSKKTNNVSVTSSTLNSLNEVSATTSSTYTYDGNGNRSTRSDNGTARYTYDDENQLVEVDKDPATYSAPPRTDLVYDGLMRLRKRTEYTWNGSIWSLTGETRYVYDGMTVVQELNSSNVPTVTYTRGNDLSGALQDAGGIGGLLARSSGYSAGSWSTHNFYHADGNGNITALVDSTQTLSATYKYDPFGKTISSSGTMATANVYRFSSKEYHAPSDLYYYGYRWYDPSAQRWLNRDPLSENGGSNLYEFDYNNPNVWIDPDGQSPEGAVIGGGAGAVIGGIIGGSVGSIGIVIPPFAPFTITIGADGGAAIGAVIGEWIGGLLPASSTISHCPGNKPPFTGQPDSTVIGGTGSREYGPDGYPVKDRDLPHPDEKGPGSGDHSHDWTRPPGGGPPTHKDRSLPRLPRPDDPPIPRGPNVPAPNPT